MPGFLTEPLRAIDRWSSVISTNITDVNLPGFKLRRINFSDAGVNIDRLPEPSSFTSGVAAGGRVSLMMPVPTLNVASAPIDFSQGTIETTGVDTHYAIKDRPGSPGTNFFLLVKDFDDTGIPARTVAYLSRDGEFHWTDRVPDGLAVNPDFFNPGSGAFETGTPPGPYLVNSYGMYVVGVRDFRAGSTTDTGRLYQPLGQLAQGFFQPHINPLTGLNEPPVHPIVLNVKFPNNLQYSEYGANTFILTDRDQNGNVRTNDVAAAATSLPLAGDGYRYYSADPANPFASPNQQAVGGPFFNPGQKHPGIGRRANVFADVEQGALERANYTLMPLFPEMSQVQRTFVSISKIITVLTQNMDAILNTTR